MAAGLSALSQGFGRALRAWAHRRQGTDPHDLELLPRRIYILPTRSGLIFALIIFVMLLGAMNYNNNLGFALTFLLAATAVISINHCHYNLARLRLSAMGSEPVFAGEDFHFRFALHNNRDRPRWQVRLGWDRDARTRCIDLAPNAQAIVVLPLRAEHRGRCRVPRVRVSSSYPLGLFESWAWLTLELDGVAYPRPADHSFGQASGDQAQAGAHPSGEDDYSGMRQWRAGDSPRRMAWKAFARTGQRLVHEYEGAGAPVWIDWESEDTSDLETGIARLCRRVLDADAGGREYGLRLPGTTVNPDRGPGQRHRCLTALALWQPGGSPT